MSNETSINDTRDEQQLGGLIRRSGVRVQPSGAARQAARAAVHAEWRAMVMERSRRQQNRWSLAAAAAVAGLAVWLTLPVLQAPALTVANVARVTGPVEISDGNWWSRTVAARVGEAVATGAEIRSGSGGRAALQLGDVSLRLDENTTLTVAAADRVELRRGAVYLDSGRDGALAGALRVATAYGTVEHVGTQYETRLLDDGLRVRVREGLVRVSRDGTRLDGRAGEQLTLRSSGTAQRAPVARSGAEWAWVGEIAPKYDLENRSLAEFLRWVGRETGREVAFESAAAQAEARRVTLRGSTAGLSPERALPVVLSTTQLGYSEQPERLLVSFKSGETR